MTTLLTLERSYLKMVAYMQPYLDTWIPVNGIATNKKVATKMGWPVLVAGMVAVGYFIDCHPPPQENNRKKENDDVPNPSNTINTTNLLRITTKISQRSSSVPSPRDSWRIPWWIHRGIRMRGRLLNGGWGYRVWVWLRFWRCHVRRGSWRGQFIRLLVSVGERSAGFMHPVLTIFFSVDSLKALHAQCSHMLMLGLFLTE